MQKHFALFFALLAAISILQSRPVRADSPAISLDDVVGQISPSIVTVKIVLKVQYSRGGESQDQESRTELHGTVVTSSGLIMISNASFSVDRLAEMMGAPSDNPGIKITPTDFKVIFAHDITEYPATQVATDTVFGLTFIKITGPLPAVPLTVALFSETEKPVLGEDIVEVSRLGKGYDYAPLIARGQIAGTIEKPRKAWIVNGSLSELGLPVISVDGTVIGILTSIESGVQDDSSDMYSFNMIMRMFGGGSTPVDTFLVPASAVNGVIGEAVKQASQPGTPAQSEPKLVPALSAPPVAQAAPPKPVN